MALTYDVLKEKILGCFNGKNIGGALGAPFECYRGTFPVNYYTQKDIDNNPPPNDDLDLQLVWLNAVETFGNKITPDILADYWLTYITPVWSEYGIGKSNLKRGLKPPFSGKVGNYYGRSNGAYIRSEVWACLAPGNPEIASHFAYMDACVDHYGDGIYGEMFFAAVESAAFIVSDTDKLIDIGLSYIPEDCRLKKAILFVKDLYKKGVEFETARISVMNTYPGTFGVIFRDTYEREIITKNYGDYTEAEVGDDVVNTIALTVLAWYYGEGDFEKSICLATYCGEDADCTASTIGALMGIILGNKGIPEKWLKPIGPTINVGCVNLFLGPGGAIPKTTEDLCDRILTAIPKFLDRGLYKIIPTLTVKTQDETSGYDVVPGGKKLVKDEKFLYAKPYPLYYKNGSRDCNGYNFTSGELNRLGEYSLPFTFDTIRATVTLDKEPKIMVGDQLNVNVKVMDNGMLRQQVYVDVKIYTPDGISVIGSTVKTVAVHNAYEADGVCDFTLSIDSLNAPSNTILIDFSVQGRHSGYTARVNLLSK